MKLKQLPFISGILSLAFAAVMVAFIPANAPVEGTHISYDEQVDSWVNVPSGSTHALHKFDHLELVRKSETLKVQRSIGRDNAPNIDKTWTSITPRPKSYETQPGRFVSNEYGTKLYDANGRLVADHPLSKKAQAVRKNLSASNSKLGNNFPYHLNQSKIDNINKGGKVEIITLKDGTLGIYRSVQGRDGKPQFKSFTTLEHIGEDQYIPVKTVETNYRVSPYSGVCLEYVSRSKFSNYIVNGKSIRK